MDKNTGGFVFPQTDYTHNVQPNTSGMTLRDWFVGQALAGVIYHYYGNYGEEDCCAMAYKIADAMIKEREK